MTVLRTLGLAMVAGQETATDAWARLDWSPQARQAEAEALAADVDELLYGGAAGGGKSEWLLAHAAAEMLLHPGNRGVIFRRVMPSLTRSLLPRAQAMLAGHARYVGSPNNEFRFPNGSVLEFAHLEHEHTVARYNGAEYGFIGFEEVTEFLASQWDYLRTRLRAPVEGVRPHMIATTNPGGIGHRWVKRRWVRPDPADIAEGTAVAGERWLAKSPQPGRPPVTRAFLPATLADNPALTARDPGYRDRVLSIADPGLRKAMAEGDWDAIEQAGGQVFPPGKWVIVDHLPLDDWRCTGWVLGWDLAATAGEGDWTVGVLMGRLPDQRFVVARVWRGQWGVWERDRVMQEAAAETPPGTVIRLPQDPGQAGKDQAQRMVREFAGRRVSAVRPTGSKMTRADGLARQQQAGNVLVVRGPWLDGWLDEFEDFRADEKHDHDDQVDAAADAFNELVGGMGAPVVSGQYENRARRVAR